MVRYSAEAERRREHPSHGGRLSRSNAAVRTVSTLVRRVFCVPTCLARLRYAGQERSASALVRRRQHRPRLQKTRFCAHNPRHRHVRVCIMQHRLLHRQLVRRCGIIKLQPPLRVFIPGALFVQLLRCVSRTLLRAPPSLHTPRPLLYTRTHAGRLTLPIQVPASVCQRHTPSRPVCAAVCAAVCWTGAVVFVGLLHVSSAVVVTRL